MTTHRPVPDIATTIDYEFIRGLRSVQFATGWLGRRAALRDLVTQRDEPSYAWCRSCRLNKRHDLMDPVTMMVRCQVCGDEHGFRSAG